jgi:PhnB protein
MSKVNPIPVGFHTVTPFLYVRNAKQFIEFTQAAFGAQETVYHELPNGQAHAEIKIGNSMIMIGETTPAPASIYLYVHDVDAVYERAVEAGAKSIGAPSDKPYGDRNATVEDAHGITWFIGSRIEEDDVIARRMKEGK